MTIKLGRKYLLLIALCAFLWNQQAGLLTQKITIENKIVYLETVIKYLDGVLKSIAGRGWDIKNAIQWKNFEAGLM